MYLAANYIKSSKPKAGTQTKKFKFIELIVLETEVKDFGKIKLTVGVKKDSKKIQYCITAK